MTVYESIYGGAPSYLIPKDAALKELNAGYQASIGELGIPIDARTANQLGELNIKLNPGQKHVEVGAINQAVWDSIPEQHLDEIRRQLKLVNVSASVHAPLAEFSGIGERGGWEEANRLGAEKQLESALIRSHKLDPNGNISVTTHSTAGLPEMMQKIKAYNPETQKVEEMTTGMYIIDSESGKINTIQEQKRFFPEGEGEFTGKPQKFEPDKELAKINKDTWTSQLSDINRHANYGEEILDKARNIIAEKATPEEANKILAKLSQKDFDSEFIDNQDDRELFKTAQRETIHGQIYLRDAYRNMKNLFDRAYQNADEEDKKKLKKFAEDVSPKVKNGIEDPENIQILSDVVEKGVRVLGEIKNPVIFKPLQEFVLEKSAQTFGNAATAAFKKFGDTAPVLNIENPPAGGGLSRGEELKEVVERSRKAMADNLVKEGMGRGQAERTAEKFIGATWDVGHINMIRKKGYTDEDVVEDTKIIAPFVKHVHLSDNFGLEHTELPMGMGNVPMKEMMKKLGEKGFEGKKIVEAGNWWQYFSEKGGGNPLRQSFEAMNSPIYEMKAGPYWSQLGAYGAYFSERGATLPDVHFRTYGAHFESLPLELGGQMPGDRGRFSGTPNQ